MNCETHTHICRWLASLWGLVHRFFRSFVFRPLVPSLSGSITLALSQFLFFFLAFALSFSFFSLPTLLLFLFFSFSFLFLSFPFLSFWFNPLSLEVFFFGELVVELRATVSCYSCGEGGAWLTSLSVLFVSIDSGSSKPFWVLAWGQEARGAPSSARVRGGGGLLKFVKTPFTTGLLLDLWRAAADAFAGMDPTQQFPDDTHDDDMVWPQPVPKMISEMQPWSERGWSCRRRS